MLSQSSKCEHSTGKYKHAKTTSRNKDSDVVQCLIVIARTPVTIFRRDHVQYRVISRPAPSLRELIIVQS